MSLSRHFRDPVHGFIELEPHEVRLVDTPCFQRLRRIRQLAMAHLAFHGALHTRFEHSLGTCHVAGRMANNLGLKEGGEETRLVRIAALLHDLGHGPFSHTLEAALASFSGLQGTAGRQEKLHEKVTAEIIRHDSRIGRILSSEERKHVIALLERGYGEPMLRGIVSGPIDADKMDYLLRDSLFCGVQYGVFDVAQLLRNITEIRNPDNSGHLGVKEDGVQALEQFVLAKYYLTSQVLKHKVRRVTDEMLTRAFRLAVESEEHGFLADIIGFTSGPDSVEKYIRWHDEMLLARSGELASEAARDIFGRLRSRRLFKVVFDEPLSQLVKEDQALVLSGVCEPKATNLRKQLERHVADAMAGAGGEKIAADFVIVHVYSYKDPLEQSSDEGPILIRPRAGQDVPRLFEDVSQIFHSIETWQEEKRLAVYCPLEYDTDDERRRLLASLDGPIRQVLADFGGGEDGGR